MAPQLFSIETRNPSSGKWEVTAQVYGKRDANFTYKQIKTTNPYGKIRMVAL